MASSDLRSPLAVSSAGTSGIGSLNFSPSSGEVPSTTTSQQQQRGRSSSSSGRAVSQPRGSSSHASPGHVRGTSQSGAGVASTGATDFLGRRSQIDPSSSSSFPLTENPPFGTASMYTTTSNFGAASRGGGGAGGPFHSNASVGGSSTTSFGYRTGLGFGHSKPVAPLDVSSVMRQLTGHGPADESSVSSASHLAGGGGGKTLRGGLAQSSASAFTASSPRRGMNQSQYSVANGASRITQINTSQQQQQQQSPVHASVILGSGRGGGAAATVSVDDPQLVAVRAVMLRELHIQRLTSASRRYAAAQEAYFSSTQLPSQQRQLARTLIDIRSEITSLVLILRASTLDAVECIGKWVDREIRARASLAASGIAVDAFGSVSRAESPIGGASSRGRRNKAGLLISSSRGASRSRSMSPSAADRQNHPSILGDIEGGISGDVASAAAAKLRKSMQGNNNNKHNDSKYNDDDGEGHVDDDDDTLLHHPHDEQDGFSESAPGVGYQDKIGGYNLKNESNGPPAFLWRGRNYILQLAIDAAQVLVHARIPLREWMDIDPRGNPTFSPSSVIPISDNLKVTTLHLLAHLLRIRPLNWGEVVSTAPSNTNNHNSSSSSSSKVHHLQTGSGEGKGDDDDEEQHQHEAGGRAGAGKEYSVSGAFADYDLIDALGVKHQHGAAGGILTATGDNTSAVALATTTPRGLLATLSSSLVPALPAISENEQQRMKIVHAAIIMSVTDAVKQLAQDQERENMRVAGLEANNRKRMEMEAKKRADDESKRLEDKLREAMKPTVVMRLEGISDPRHISPRSMKYRLDLYDMFPPDVEAPPHTPASIHPPEPEPRIPTPPDELRLKLQELRDTISTPEDADVVARREHMLNLLRAKTPEAEKAPSFSQMFAKPNVPSRRNSLTGQLLAVLATVDDAMVEIEAELEHRRKFSDMNFCSTKIQSFFRGHKQRVLYAIKYKLEHGATRKIQSNYRGYLYRKRVGSLLKLRRSALKMETWWRMIINKKRFRLFKEHILTMKLKHASAITFQAIVRGLLARRKVSGIRRVQNLIAKVVKVATGLHALKLSQVGQLIITAYSNAMVHGREDGSIIDGTITSGVLPDPLRPVLLVLQAALTVVAPLAWRVRGVRPSRRMVTDPLGMVQEYTRAQGGFLMTTAAQKNAAALPGIDVSCHVNPLLPPYLAAAQAAAIPALLPPQAIGPVYVDEKGEWFTFRVMALTDIAGETGGLLLAPTALAAASACLLDAAAQRLAGVLASLSRCKAGEEHTLPEEAQRLAAVLPADLRPTVLLLLTWTMLVCRIAELTASCLPARNLLDTYEKMAAASAKLQARAAQKFIVVGDSTIPAYHLLGLRPWVLRPRPVVIVISYDCPTLVAEHIIRRLERDGGSSFVVVDPEAELGAIPAAGSAASKGMLFGSGAVADLNRNLQDATAASAKHADEIAHLASGTKAGAAITEASGFLPPTAHRYRGNAGTYRRRMLLRLHTVLSGGHNAIMRVALGAASFSRERFVRDMRDVNTMLRPHIQAPVVVLVTGLGFTMSTGILDFNTSETVKRVRGGGAAGAAAAPAVVSPSPPTAAEVSAAGANIMQMTEVDPSSVSFLSGTEGGGGGLDHHHQQAAGGGGVLGAGGLLPPGTAGNDSILSGISTEDSVLSIPSTILGPEPSTSSLPFPAIGDELSSPPGTSASMVVVNTNGNRRGVGAGVGINNNANGQQQQQQQSSSSSQHQSPADVIEPVLDALANEVSGLTKSVLVPREEAETVDEIGRAVIATAMEGVEDKRFLLPPLHRMIFATWAAPQLVPPTPITVPSAITTTTTTAGNADTSRVEKTSQDTGRSTSPLATARSLLQKAGISSTASPKNGANATETTLAPAAAPSPAVIPVHHHIHVGPISLNDVLMQARVAQLPDSVSIACVQRAAAIAAALTAGTVSDHRSANLLMTLSSDRASQVSRALQQDQFMKRTSIAASSDPEAAAVSTLSPFESTFRVCTGLTLTQATTGRGSAAMALQYLLQDDFSTAINALSNSSLSSTMTAEEKKEIEDVVCILASLISAASQAARRTSMVAPGMVVEEVVAVAKSGIGKKGKNINQQKKGASSSSPANANLGKHAKSGYGAYANVGKNHQAKGAFVSGITSSFSSVTRSVALDLGKRLLAQGPQRLAARLVAAVPRLTQDAGNALRKAMIWMEQLHIPWSHAAVGTSPLSTTIVAPSLDPRALPPLFRNRLLGASPAITLLAHWCTNLMMHMVCIHSQGGPARPLIGPQLLLDIDEDFRKVTTELTESPFTSIVHVSAQGPPGLLDGMYASAVFEGIAAQVKNQHQYHRRQQGYHADAYDMSSASPPNRRHPTQHHASPTASHSHNNNNISSTSHHPVSATDKSGTFAFDATISPAEQRFVTALLENPSVRLLGKVADSQAQLVPSKNLYRRSPSPVFSPPSHNNNSGLETSASGSSSVVAGVGVGGFGSGNGRSPSPLSPGRATATAGGNNNNNTSSMVNGGLEDGSIGGLSTASSSVIMMNANNASVMGIPEAAIPMITYARGHAEAFSHVLAAHLLDVRVFANESELPVDFVPRLDKHGQILGCVASTTAANIASSTTNTATAIGSTPKGNAPSTTNTISAAATASDPMVTSPAAINILNTLVRGPGAVLVSAVNNNNNHHHHPHPHGGATSVTHSNSHGHGRSGSPVSKTTDTVVSGDSTSNSNYNHDLGDAFLRGIRIAIYRDLGRIVLIAADIASGSMRWTSMPDDPFLLADLAAAGAIRLRDIDNGLSQAERERQRERDKERRRRGDIKIRSWGGLIPMLRVQMPSVLIPPTDTLAQRPMLEPGSRMLVRPAIFPLFTTVRAIPCMWGVDANPTSSTTSDSGSTMAFATIAAFAEAGVGICTGAFRAKALLFRVNVASSSMNAATTMDLRVSSADITAFIALLPLASSETILLRSPTATPVDVALCLLDRMGLYEIDSSLMMMSPSAAAANSSHSNTYNTTTMININTGRDSVNSMLGASSPTSGSVGGGSGSAAGGGGTSSSAAAGHRSETPVTFSVTGASNLKQLLNNSSESKTSHTGDGDHHPQQQQSQSQGGGSGGSGLGGLINGGLNGGGSVSNSGVVAITSADPALMRSENYLVLHVTGNNSSSTSANAPSTPSSNSSSSNTGGGSGAGFTATSANGVAIVPIPLSFGNNFLNATSSSSSSSSAPNSPGNASSAGGPPTTPGRPGTTGFAPSVRVGTLQGNAGKSTTPGTTPSAIFNPTVASIQPSNNTSMSTSSGTSSAASTDLLLKTIPGFTAVRAYVYASASDGIRMRVTPGSYETLVRPVILSAGLRSVSFTASMAGYEEPTSSSPLSAMPPYVPIQGGGRAFARSMITMRSSLAICTGLAECLPVTIKSSATNRPLAIACPLAPAPDVVRTRIASSNSQVVSSRKRGNSSAVGSGSGSNNTSRATSPTGSPSSSSSSSSALASSSSSSNNNNNNNNNNNSVPIRLALRIASGGMGGKLLGSAIVDVRPGAISGAAAAAATSGTPSSGASASTADNSNSAMVKNSMSGGANTTDLNVSSTSGDAAGAPEQISQRNTTAKIVNVLTKSTIGKEMISGTQVPLPPRASGLSIRVSVFEPAWVTEPHINRSRLSGASSSGVSASSAYSDGRETLMNTGSTSPSRSLNLGGGGVNNSDDAGAAGSAVTAVTTRMRAKLLDERVPHRLIIVVDGLGPTPTQEEMMLAATGTSRPGTSSTSAAAAAAAVSLSTVPESNSMSDITSSSSSSFSSDPGSQVRRALKQAVERGEAKAVSPDEAVHLFADHTRVFLPDSVILEINPLERLTFLGGVKSILPVLVARESYMRTDEQLQAYTKARHDLVANIASRIQALQIAPSVVVERAATAQPSILKCLVSSAAATHAAEISFDRTIARGTLKLGFARYIHVAIKVPEPIDCYLQQFPARTVDAMTAYAMAAAGVKATSAVITTKGAGASVTSPITFFGSGMGGAETPKKHRSRKNGQQQQQQGGVGAPLSTSGLIVTVFEDFQGGTPLGTVPLVESEIQSLLTTVRIGAHEKASADTSRRRAQLLAESNKKKKEKQEAAAAARAASPGKGATRSTTPTNANASSSSGSSTPRATTPTKDSSSTATSSTSGNSLTLTSPNSLVPQKPYELFLDLPTAWPHSFEELLHASSPLPNTVTCSEPLSTYVPPIVNTSLPIVIPADGVVFPTLVSQCNAVLSRVPVLIGERPDEK